MKKSTLLKHHFNGVMTYHNEPVIKRIARDHDYDYLTAYEIFQDTKRFLYLCKAYGGGLVPTAKIDEGWHSFILFTKDYLDFCMNHFGAFIHHYPTPDDGSKKDGIRQVQRTLMFAEIEFGELSTNWNYFQNKHPELDVTCSIDAPCSDNPCSSCTGTTNCQN